MIALFLISDGRERERDIEIDRQREREREIEIDRQRERERETICLILSGDIRH